MKAIINGKLILKDKILTDHVIVFNEKIIDIIPNTGYAKKYLEVEEIDAKEKYVSPGFIDIHIHGANGSDVMDGDLEALNNISKSISKSGTTSFLPTTMTMKPKLILKALENIEKNKNKVQGAQILGAHLEGPFINENYNGAHNKNHIMEPNFELIKDYLDIIKIITYAPEKDKNLNFTKKVIKHGDILLSMGHTEVDYQKSLEATEEGVKHITHMFNAMSKFHHRDPGVIGSAFKTNIKCEFIADKIHVSQDVFDILFDIKGPDRIILITDSIRASYMEDGEYDLGGQRITVNDGEARLKNGVLAGSILKQNEAVYNFWKNSKATLPQVIKMVSVVPARSLNLDSKKGEIKVGLDADITIFNDQIKIDKTILKGETIYQTN